mgnify:CR=1 FL=1
MILKKRRIFVAYFVFGATAATKRCWWMRNMKIFVMPMLNEKWGIRKERVKWKRRFLLEFEIYKIKTVTTTINNNYIYYEIKTKYWNN